jgi:DNA-binding CsgD family transcriptional regulator
MAKSSATRLTDIRNLFRILGECRDLRADASEWRQHAFNQIGKMLGARGVTGGEIAWARPNGVVRFLHPVVTGFSEAEISVFAAFMRERDPQSEPIFGPLGRHRSQQLTCTRRQLVGDRDWYRSVSFNEYRRRVGVDHCLYTLFALPGADAFSVLGLHRPVGEPSFGGREKHLLHLFHDELCRLTGAVLTREMPFSGLSRRLRQTLAGLLHGDSEKQVALRLQLSEPTVHQYVTALYRHFGVNSRAELLVQFIARPHRQRS